MEIVKRLLREMFIAKEAIPIDEIPPPDEIKPVDFRRKKNGRQKAGEEQARVKIAILANRLVGASLLVTLCFVVIYPFVQPERKIPDVIQNIASGCIGYFASAVTMFLGKRDPG